MSRFIDVDVHPPAPFLCGPAFEGYLDPATTPDCAESFEELAAHYRDIGGIALVHAFDAGSVTGSVALSNAEVAAAVEEHPDVLVGIGCVDPHRGSAAVVAAHDALRMGLRGLYFHPPAQQFDPAGRRYSALWGMAEDLRLPVIVHCGVTAFGRGVRGGAGIRLDCADPMRMDYVAARHPGLTIILSGITEPFEMAALAVASHKGNVYLAPAVPPKEMTMALGTAAKGQLAEKVMIGSGYPFGSPAEWVAGWSALRPLKAVAESVLAGNAAALFGL